MREPVYVVGTDLSAPSRKALDAAAELARRTGARIQLVCIVPRDLARSQPDLADRVAPILRSMLGDAGCDGAQAHVVVAADAATALAHHSHAVGADLLVVAPRGAGGRKGALGSVTERLLREAPARLLVVRGALPGPSGQILAAVDLRPGSRRALRTAVELARTTGSRVVALHVVPPLQVSLAGAPMLYLPGTLRAEGRRIAEMRTRFAAWVREFPSPGVEVEARTVPGHPVVAILDEAREGGARLVVVGAHGTTAVHALFVGSVARGVATGCPVSVLVVRARPAERRRRAPEARGGGTPAA